MDVLPRVHRPLTDLVRQMTPLQQAVSVAITSFILIGLGWLFTQYSAAPHGRTDSGGPTETSSHAQILQATREFTHFYEHQIQKALDFLVGVNVTVHVPFDTLKSIPQFRNSTAEIGHSANQPAIVNNPAQNLPTGILTLDADRQPTGSDSRDRQSVTAPKSVLVTISIPQDGLRDLVQRRAANEQKSAQQPNLGLLEEEELARIERIVRRLIPADSSSDAISLIIVPGSRSPSVKSTLFTYQDEFLGWLQPHGGLAIVFGLLAMAGIVLFRNASKTRANATPTSTPAVDEIRSQHPVVPTELSHPLVTPVDQMAALRDEVRSMAGSDPAASAELLSKWLSEITT